MRIYQTGAMEPATMSSDLNLPFMLCQFPNMTQPILSGIAVLAAEDLPGEGDKPLKRPAANNVLMRPAKKRPAADDGDVVPLHAFQVTSTVTSMPVRSYLTACRCQDPDKVPMSSHKRELLVEFRERDFVQHHEMARRAWDFIEKNKLRWEQARNIRAILTAEDVE